MFARKKQHSWLELASSRSRFISTDPLGHAASADLYNYANCDPINFVDPWGRGPLVASAFAGALVGGTWAYFDGNPDTTVYAGVIGGFVTGSGAALLSSALGGGVIGTASAAGIAGFTGHAATQGLNIFGTDKTMSDFSVTESIKVAAFDTLTAGTLRSTGLDRVISKSISRGGRKIIDDGLNSGSTYVDGLVRSNLPDNKVNLAADKILENLRKFEDELLAYAPKANAVGVSITGGIISNKANALVDADSVSPIGKKHN